MFICSRLRYTTLFLAYLIHSVYQNIPANMLSLIVMLLTYFSLEIHWVVQSRQHSNGTPQVDIQIQGQGNCLLS